MFIYINFFSRARSKGELCGSSFLCQLGKRERKRGVAAGQVRMAAKPVSKCQVEALGKC